MAIITVILHFYNIQNIHKNNFDFFTVDEKINRIKCSLLVNYSNQPQKIRLLVKFQPSMTGIMHFTVSKKCFKNNVYLLQNQKTHWKKEHNKKCCPFKIEIDPENPERGRFVIATRDLLPGDVIIEEPAITVGPKQVWV